MCCTRTPLPQQLHMKLFLIALVSGALVGGADSFVNPPTPNLGLHSVGVIHGGRSCLRISVNDLLAPGPDAALPVSSSTLTNAVSGGISSLTVAVDVDGGTAAVTGLYGAAFLLLAGAAGYLMFSAYTGENGLGTFLSKEPQDNPFYKKTMKKSEPSEPSIIDKIRLPDLDFVEVYNQPPPEVMAVEEEAMSAGISSLDQTGNMPDAAALVKADALRAELLEAVQAKDYSRASKLESELEAFIKENNVSFGD